MSKPSTPIKESAKIVVVSLISGVARIYLRGVIPVKNFEKEKFEHMRCFQ